MSSSLVFERGFLWSLKTQSETSFYSVQCQFQSELDPVSGFSVSLPALDEWGQRVELQLQSKTFLHLEEAILRISREPVPSPLVQVRISNLEKTKSLCWRALQSDRLIFETQRQGSWLVHGNSQPGLFVFRACREPAQLFSLDSPPHLDETRVQQLFALHPSDWVEIGFQNLKTLQTWRFENVEERSLRR